MYHDTLLLGSKPSETRTLVNFLKSVSMDWDFDNVNFDKSISASKRYLKKYYISCTDFDEDLHPETQRALHNWTFISTISLWSSDYLLCPMVHDFLITCLTRADQCAVTVTLPQILRALSSTGDTKTMEMVIIKIQSSPKAVTRLFWLLMMRLETHKSTRDAELSFCQAVLYNLMNVLFETPNGKTLRSSIKRSGVLVEKMVRLSAGVRRVTGNTAQKEKYLQDAIKDPSMDLTLFEPTLHPLYTEKEIIGINPQGCKVFYSQLCPILIEMVCKDLTTAKCIFKLGDDLRQDALISDTLKVIRALCVDKDVIDADNVVVYSVLPTGHGHGFVEYVASQSLDNVIAEHGSLKAYLEKLKMEKDVYMETFIESAAFYTIVTYILSVGDRHLDNILITEEGKLFHIDYGYIGREPKPFAPLVKLCPEIIEVMGNKHSGWYEMFIDRCMEVYRVCREHSGVILDMFKGTLDEGLLDINQNTIEKIRTRMAASKDFGEAWEIINGEIERGFEAKIPHLMDNFHRTWKMVNGGKRTVDADDQEWFFLD